MTSRPSSRYSRPFQSAGSIGSQTRSITLDEEVGPADRIPSIAPSIPDEGFVFVLAVRAKTSPAFFARLEETMFSHGWFSLGISQCAYWGSVNNLRAFLPCMKDFKEQVSWHRLFRYVGHRDLLAPDSSLTVPGQPSDPDESYIFMYNIMSPASTLPAEFSQYLLSTGGWRKIARGICVFERSENNLDTILPLFILQHPSLCLQMNSCHVFRLQSVKDSRCVA